MRKVAVMMMAMALIVVSGSVLSGEEEVVSKWFDMENCQMCKPMMETEGFMQNVTWESYPIANGMVSITTVLKSCSLMVSVLICSSTSWNEDACGNASNSREPAPSSVMMKIGLGVWVAKVDFP